MNTSLLEHIYYSIKSAIHFAIITFILDFAYKSDTI